MNQKLLTVAIKNAAKKFPLGSQDGKKGDAVVLARFFTPASSFTWYMLEYNQETDEAYGLVFGHETEYGYFSLNELQNAKHEVSFMGISSEIQAVERDISVDPKKYTLAELLKANGEKAPSWWSKD